MTISPVVESENEPTQEVRNRQILKLTITIAKCRHLLEFFNELLTTNSCRVGVSGTERNPASRISVISLPSGKIIPVEKDLFSDSYHIGIRLILLVYF